jgi:CheY-like chemotaxis protein
MDVRTATALLVDDDFASFHTRQQRLENDGYRVVLARSGTEGLSLARQSTPTVIYSHLGFGGCDNLAFIAALRSDNVCRHISVIVMTDRPGSVGVQKRLRPVRRDRW